MHGRPPFATRSPLRFKVSLYVYTSRCPLTFRPLPLFARACVSFLSFFLACFSIFLLHCRRGTLPAFLLLFSFIVHLHPPCALSFPNSLSLSFYRSIYFVLVLPLRTCSLSLPRFLAVFAYVCAPIHVCAFEPRRGGRDGRIASVRTGVYRPLPDSRFFLRQRGREREREQLDGEKEKQKKGERGEEKEKERERRQQGRGRKREAERTRGSKTEIDLRGSKCDRVTPK